jgi:hypothetical protein
LLAVQELETVHKASPFRARSEQVMSFWRPRWERGDLFSRFGDAVRTKLSQYRAPESPLFVRDGLHVISVGSLDCRLTSSVTADHIDSGTLGILHGGTIATIPDLELLALAVLKYH